MLRLLIIIRRNIDMTNKMRAIHPGEILKDELSELALSATAFAKLLSVPTNRVTSILNGTRSITADTALRLACFFGTSPEFWLNLQLAYDLKTTLKKEGERIKNRFTLTKKLPKIHKVELKYRQWGKMAFMKFNSMRAFQKHLEGAEKAGFAPLYLIVSAEGGQNRVAIDRLVEAIRRREGIDPMGVSSLDGPDRRTLDQEINTLSFFSAKRLVVIGGAESLDKGAEEILLRKMPPGLFVILHGKLSASPFFKKIEKRGLSPSSARKKVGKKRKAPRNG